MYIDFDDLADNSRVWIYQSTSHLDVEEVESVSASLLDFLQDWQAHGKDLTASFKIMYSRFIIVALDEASYQATGCSIDKLMQKIQQIEKNQNISLLDRMQIAWREDNFILTGPLQAFRQSLENNELDENTIVFNNLIETKGQLEKEWEVPVRASWHKQWLPVA